MKIGELIENEELYMAIRDAVHESYCMVHAIYGPGSDSVKPEWYCAAVDLVDPGMTFKLFFTLENGKIHVQELSRWWFG